MEAHTKVEAFLLTGGDSSRMGRDKSLLELGGVPMLLRVARLAELLVRRVTFVGEPERYRQFGLPGIPDAWPRGTGPLGAIATALASASCDWNLVLACDLPYLTAEWLDFLIRRALDSRADAVLPQTEHGPEPLCAMYRTPSGPTIAAALDRGVRKVTDGLADLDVQFVEPSEWKAFDSAGRLFKNMNAPADYEEARAHFEPPKR